jgi:hypothetical protein
MIRPTRNPPKAPRSVYKIPLKKLFILNLSKKKVKCVRKNKIREDRLKCYESLEKKKKKKNLNLTPLGISVWGWIIGPSDGSPY